jgi:hypothetical protein
MMEGHCLLYDEYFADDPLDDVISHRRFMMSSKLFLKIVENVREIDYFKLKRDAVGLFGFIYYLEVHNRPPDACIRCA